jgi:HPt (histidine-containing phosphotransfer) domain-containing protein
MKGDRERFLAAGMDAYVTKPIRREELWAAIGDCVPRPGRADGDTISDGRDGQTLDRTTLLARVGGNVKLLKEILLLFRSDCPRLMGELHEAVAQGNAERLRQTAHTLKGTLGNLSASDAFAAALRLEKLAVSGERAEVDDAFTSLRHRISLLDTALARFDQELKS